jgi:hypothetical protein
MADILTIVRRISSLGVFASACVMAEPSGGPYGPVEMSYDVPEANNVYFVASDGNPQAKGNSLDDPTTIEAAIGRVITGDAIVMRGGTYRTGSLRLSQGVVIQPYLDERVVFKGTQVAAEWEALRDNVWRTRWTRLFPAEPLGWWRRSREGMRTPLHRFNNDMVFIDGRFLMSAGWEGELDADSYFIDYDNGYVYIGTDPAGKLVEITAHDSALVRTSQPAHGKENDGKGPIIRGITFTQYAYRCLEVEGKRQFTSSDEPTDEPVGLADPATFGKEITGTVLENLTITYCSRVAGYFRGDGLIIRNSLVSDTSTEGIYVIGSSDVLIERNTIRRNNIERLTGYFPSAVKIFNQTRRVTFRDNLITEQPWSNGVWYDVGNRDGLIIDNWIEDTIDGFFFEISDGAIVAGNVFVRNDKGIRVLNAANVHVYHNTFVDNPASFERNGRSAEADHFGWHASTGPGVDERDGHVFVNNLLVASDDFDRPLLNFEQPASLCARLDKPMIDALDGNVYVRSAAGRAEQGRPLIRVSPAENDACFHDVASLDELREFAPGLEQDGRQIDRSPTSIFRSPTLGHYELLPALPAVVALPGAVLDRIGWEDSGTRAPGAYPVSRPD